MCEQGWGRRDEVKALRQMVEEEKERNGEIELRSFALELYGRGYGRKAITEALDLMRNTLRHWIENYTRDEHGSWRLKERYRESRKNRKSISKKRNEDSYTEAKNPDEWLSVLRKRVIEASCITDSMLLNRSIYIVCEGVNIRKGIEQLSSIIQARLQMNPFDGSVYAFCSMKQDKIRYMFWDDSGFTVVSRRSEYGRYAWPSAKLGAILEISLQDFGLILRGRSRQKGTQELEQS